MHIIRIAGCVLAVGALVVACAEQTPVDPGETATVAAPEFNWMNNPDNGNFKVYRDAFDWINCWSDAENGLRVCQGTVPLGGGFRTRLRPPARRGPRVLPGCRVLCRGRTRKLAPRPHAGRRLYHHP